MTSRPEEPDPESDDDAGDAGNRTSASAGSSRPQGSAGTPGNDAQADAETSGSGTRWRTYRANANSESTAPDASATTPPTSDNRSRQRSNPEPSAGIYAPPRRTRTPEYVDEQDDAQRPGIFARLTGRHRIDEIRAERLRPYRYESNTQMLQWTIIAMAVWCLFTLLLAFTDWSNGATYAEWRDAGIETIPPPNRLETQIEPARLAALNDGGVAMRCAYLAGRTDTPECPEGELPDAEIEAFITGNDYLCFQAAEETGFCDAVWSSRAIVDFAQQEGFDCVDGRTVFLTVMGEPEGSVGCSVILDYGEELEATTDRSQLIWLAVAAVGLIVAFPYLSTIHRASRNLLTLKSDRQKHRPEWAVLHHFIPFFNLFMPGAVMREMFKGSDPNVSTDEPEAWKTRGRIHPIAFLWHALWFLSLWMNPVILPRLLSSSTNTLAELVRNNNLLILGDLVLLALGVCAVLMLRQLHLWQQARHQIVGPITVTPPQPVDPLQAEIEKRDAAAAKSRRDHDSSDTQ